MNARPAAYLQNGLFAIFFLSGFSGLIYESVWSNYLKLFLGHAAYAQTLVLGLYMGGMAAGAWLAGRYLPRLRSPLVAYAVVELVIGLLGLLFHPVFVGTSNLMLDQVLPGIGTPWLVELVRWGFATALIAPQTLLLGATFPLISAGILRSFTHMPGHVISMLYFTNSIGAVLGVLVSGFILVAASGLPGTIMTAALINILVALLTYAHAKPLMASQAPRPSPAGGTRRLATPANRLLLPLALITGLSSFIYEVSWVRMLSMVLGASTHAFEFMLSAFILGLALGGLWLRKRIDRFEQPLLALGIIQLLMGLLALGSVLLYNSSFEWMSTLLPALQRNNIGYLFFNLISHGIALLLMLPVTFMAGMTLPLISAILFREGNDESVIGKVYASNTLGAIIGVALAAMLLLPLVGLKMTMVIGAALDLAIALVLFGQIRLPRPRQAAAWGLALSGLVATCLAAPFNNLWMASTVFRNGLLLDNTQDKILFHRDGRTATVDVAKRRDGHLYLTTNGKVDASASLDPNRPPTDDENTQILLGGLPLLAKPLAQNAAIIGIGSGASANVLLSSPHLKQLDVVEIEAAMVDAARLFGPLSARVFADPRSQIHIDDAKSYFSVHRKRYDLIISEPSDSWVSGVSSLFTAEFYQRIERHLSEDGLLVQWLHVYELSPDLISSIFLALGNQFADYRVYASNNGNLIILAKARGKVPPLDARALNNPTLLEAFRRVNFHHMDDINLHEVGNKDWLAPYFQTNGAPVNSDFFPFVDQNAVQARFKNVVFGDLPLLGTIGLPLPGINQAGTLKPSQVRPVTSFTPRLNAQIGRLLGHYLATGASGNLPETNRAAQETAMILQSRPGCHDRAAQTTWNERLVTLASLTLPNMTEQELQPMLDFLEQKMCDSTEAAPNRLFLQLMRALSRRDMAATELAALQIFQNEANTGQARMHYARNALLLAYFRLGKWPQINTIGLNKTKRDFWLDLLQAHAVLQLARAKQAQ